MPKIDLRLATQHNLELELLSLEKLLRRLEIRDDLSWTKGLHQFKFGFSWLHDYKNQQLQANTQGTADFNSSAFSGDSYVNFLLGDTSHLYPAAIIWLASIGSTTTMASTSMTTGTSFRD